MYHFLALATSAAGVNLCDDEIPLPGQIPKPVYVEFVLYELGTRSRVPGIKFNIKMLQLVEGC